MALADRYNFEDLVNEAERLVLDELESQLLAAPGGIESFEEDAVLDMAAFALNNVRPLYRINLLGRLYAQNVGDRYAAEIEAAVREAINRVSSNPS